MNAKAAKPLNPLRWLGLPVLLCIGATVLFSATWRIFGFSLPEPVFAMAPAFAWALIRPSILAPFAVLLMGTFLDIFWGGQRGLWSLSLLAAYGAVLVTRPIIMGQGRLIMWIWYCAACAVAMGAGYVLVIAATGNLADPIAVLWQYLATAVLFPFADNLIERFEDADVRFR
ncbi:MAG: hypothetical protein U1E50_00230 [Caulobacteraceae bacterium]